MNPEYVEKREDGYWIAGTRVALDSIVYNFLDGASPETVAEDFPGLSLEQIFGALAYYLRNRAEIDAYLAQEDQEFATFRERVRAEYPHLHRKLDEIRESVGSHSK